MSREITLYEAPHSTLPQSLETGTDTTYIASFALQENSAEYLDAVKAYEADPLFAPASNMHLAHLLHEQAQEAQPASALVEDYRSKSPLTTPFPLANLPDVAEFRPEVFERAGRTPKENQVEVMSLRAAASTGQLDRPKVYVPAFSADKAVQHEALVAHTTFQETPPPEVDTLRRTLTGLRVSKQRDEAANFDPWLNRHQEYKGVADTTVTSSGVELTTATPEVKVAFATPQAETPQAATAETTLVLRVLEGLRAMPDFVTKENVTVELTPQAYEQPRKIGQAMLESLGLQMRRVRDADNRLVRGEQGGVKREIVDTNGQHITHVDIPVQAAPGKRNFESVFSYAERYENEARRAIGRLVTKLSNVIRFR